MRKSSLQPSLNQHRLAPHVSLSRPQQWPCQSSCGQARVWVALPNGNAEDANMGGTVGDEELERVFESIDGAEDRPRVDSAKGEALDVVQLVAKRRLAGRSKP